jgi:hypothetical protein
VAARKADSPASPLFLLRRVVDLAATPHEVSWMADGRTLAVSYARPTNSSGPKLSMAVAALDPASGAWMRQRRRSCGAL